MLDNGREWCCGNGADRGDGLCLECTNDDTCRELNSATGKINECEMSSGGCVNHTSYSASDLIDSVDVDIEASQKSTGPPMSHSTYN
jgi:hypothetical protein